MLFIERQIKALKIFSPKTWCTKKPFSYRVAHKGYLLTSFPEDTDTDFNNFYNIVILLKNIIKINLYYYKHNYYKKQLKKIFPAVCKH